MSEHKTFKIRLKKGDTVIVRSGKHKGKTSKILKTHPRENKVTVEGINVYKKHIKPSRVNAQGGIIEITKPIWVSKVSILDTTNKTKPVASKIAYTIDKDGTKTRIYKKSGKEIK